jgi:hypothetical protein
MTNRITKLAATGLALAAVAPAAVPAAIHNPQSDAAMRKAIRGYAKDGVKGKTLKLTKLKVDCVQATKISSTRPCSGTFSLTLAGKTANYKLNKKSNTFRNSPGSIIANLNATATKKAAGLPSKVKWGSILQ